MKKAVVMFLLLSLLVMSNAVYAVDILPGGLPAFPGAEGGGMYTTGARAVPIPEIYHVENLNDSGPGSLRDAVSIGNRIIVFDVAGTINLTKGLTLKAPNITILGQTSPGDGICVSGAPTTVSADNIIIRYMRFRMGVYDYENHKYDADSFGGTYNTSNLIVDHCSMSWSSDECCSVYAVKDSTIQWCIITEPINIGIHYEEGQLQAHGYGGIWGGKNMSYHHNLVASSISRYPLVGTSATVHSYNYEPDYMSLLDIRNNVFYNWQSNSSHGGQNMVRVNLVNNYYKMGPASKDLKRFYKMMGTQPENQSSYPIVGAATDLAIDGNYYDAIKPSEKVALINSDNVFGVEFDNYTETYNLEKYDETAEPSEKSHTQYIKDYPITTESAIEAFGSVVQSAGHNFPRDSVDERAVNDTVKRISTVGENGILNYDKFILLEKPEYYGTGKLDSDGDGIPDDWEDSHELNKNNPADSLKIANENQYDGKYTGYLNIEAYSFGILENPPEPTEDPTSSPLPTSAPARGIYYAKSPEISGANITASIVNENDESGAVFAACSYDESGKIMTDVKIVRIPKSDIPQDINVTLKSDKNIKTYLWTSRLEPARN